MYNPPMTTVTCAQHEGVSAVSLCKVCGRVMCNECQSLSANGMCAECAELANQEAFVKRRKAAKFDFVWFAAVEIITILLCFTNDPRHWTEDAFVPCLLFGPGIVMLRVVMRYFN